MARQKKIETSAGPSIPITLPPQFEPFLSPHRYKVSYGGRGGGKSISIAKMLLYLGVAQPLRILCAREIQSSITDSVHKILSDEISNMKLGEGEGQSGFYTVGRDTITGKNGTTFRFAGLRTNPQQIKSFAHLDIVWVEEAANVTKESWDILIPTMRDGMTYAQSEIWVSFNPIRESDNTYQRFVVDPPSNSVVIKTNWQDNPWFPAVLMQEMEDCKARSIDDYEHIWLGKCQKYLEGAVYADEIRNTEAAERFTTVAYEKLAPVDTFWDLGSADKTCIWVTQRVGHEIRLIDYVEGRRQELDWYLKVLSERPYPIETFYLPHDARAVSLGSKMSIEEIMRGKGKRVKIVPKLKIVDGINAVRTVFNRLFFDVKNCGAGIEALRNYHYDLRKDRFGGFANEPVHDDNSHAADALRYLAVTYGRPKTSDGDEQPKYAQPLLGGGQHGWMQF